MIAILSPGNNTGDLPNMATFMQRSGIRLISARKHQPLHTGLEKITTRFRRHVVETMPRRMNRIGSVAAIKSLVFSCELRPLFPQGTFYTANLNELALIVFLQLNSLTVALNTLILEKNLKSSI